jgi:hydrogenase maturation factor
MASVRTARGVEIVATVLVEPVGPGDLVLVHAGTAISKLGEDA